MSDIEDHYESEPGRTILGYRIVRKLGTGTFGRVFECVQTTPLPTYPAQQSKHKKKFKYSHQERAARDEEALREAEQEIYRLTVAVKVIRPVAKYVDEAKQECDVMRKLTCPFIAKLIDAQPMGDRFVMVMPKYGMNLYSIIKKRGYTAIKTDLALLYIEQLLKAVAHMHERGYAHTDIKPENILVEDMGHIERGIKLIDMGGTHAAADYGRGTIYTRQYRAPEVVLGLEWDEKADIWSVGCTLAELLLGELLFPVHDDRTHLAMIERVVGDFPGWMSMGNRNFDCGVVKFPCMGYRKETIETVCDTTTLKHMFGDDNRVYALVRRMLVIDPTERSSAQELCDKIARWRERGKWE